MAYHCKGLFTVYLLAKFHNSTICSVRYIEFQITKKKFKVQVNPETLTFGQGHHMTYTFEGLSIGYHLPKFQNSTLNNARDIQSQKQ